jgi:hypothetical protein
MGVKLSPGGEILCHPSILLNSRECSPQGVNISPRGQISPLGVKLPLGDRVEVKNGPLVSQRTK